MFYLGCVSLPVRSLLSFEFSLFDLYCQEGRQALVKLPADPSPKNNLTNQFICLDGHFYFVRSIFRLRERTRIPFIPVSLFYFVIKRRRLWRESKSSIVKESCRDTVIPGRVVEIGIPAGAVPWKLEDKSLQQNYHVIFEWKKTSYFSKAM